jgi:hypothetical protein
VANRSHIYAFDRFEAGLPLTPRGLHEWNWRMPPSHLMLLSGKPRAYQSLIRKGRRVAIVADAEPGVTRFLAFLRALEASNALDESFVEDARTAEAFLASEAGKGRFILCEPFELFAMNKTDWEAQCAAVVQKQIPQLVAQVDALLARPPSEMFTKPPKWLAEVRKEWSMNLGLGDWGPNLFFRLDGER